jgi:hypothetical protein
VTHAAHKRAETATERGSGAPLHEITVVDGRFAIATCSCGWTGAGRRQRSAARAEAHDHALLYAGGPATSETVVVASPADAPRPVPATPRV